MVKVDFSVKEKFFVYIKNFASFTNNRKEPSYGAPLRVICEGTVKGGLVEDIFFGYFVREGFISPESISKNNGNKKHCNSGHNFKGEGT